jgi:hypothetical protein
LFVGKIVFPVESHPLKNNTHTKNKGKRNLFMSFIIENKDYFPVPAQVVLGVTPQAVSSPLIGHAANSQFGPVLPT